ncbi:G2 M phase-specific E3 ubiquitin- ligase-like protein [Labeo rohita]|uniref:G2 M phase-specific E3 ubiquitin-ligase-like protein n=1 Tax=Labeo rohita TaxID=84645 RepID=A0A498NYT4_LABRO|nr:G2 M phase-specific E3 ubiquitin- ligase-like protein [Labeo rohita]
MTEERARFSHGEQQQQQVVYWNGKPNGQITATGGNGRRRVSVIPLEAEGYTGSVIKSASGGGKNLLYIVPLQDELDMTPLPPDAPEFARMPKATCKKCKTLMPLQTLALHVDQCDSMQNSENSEIEEDDLLLVEEATSSRQSLSPKVGTSNFEHQIEDACDLSNYTKEILDCGYTGPVNTDHKESILRALELHITTKCIPMLQQLREGLEIYDLTKVMQRKPRECHDLFVIGYDDQVDSHYILSHLAPEMSPSGSIKQVKESKIMEFFQDFLLELEGMD